MKKQESSVQSADTNSRPELKLDWCSYAATKYAIEHWHYSRSLPAPPYVRIGVWEQGVFIGCILFSRGATQNLCKPYGLKINQVCELTRVALRKHSVPVSRIVSISLRFLRKRCPGLRLCVSFADPYHGHVGGIYQAGNWIYAGQTPKSKGYRAPDGKFHHARTISPSGQKKQFGVYKAVFKPEQCVVVNLPGKHRYLMPLTQDTKATVERLRKPYPKRVRSETDDTSAVQAGKGGSTPTRTLHSHGRKAAAVELVS